MTDRDKSVLEALSDLVESDEGPFFAEVLDIILRLNAENAAIKDQEKREHEYCKNICEPNYKSKLKVYEDAFSKSFGLFNLIGNAIVFTSTQEEYDSAIKSIQNEAVKEFAQTLRKEIEEALENNHTIKTNRIDKLIERGIRFNDDFCHIVDGKILALRGIDEFIENLVKERTGEV